MSKIKNNSKLKKDLWHVFSKYIRLRDALKTTGTNYSARCITCSKEYPITGIGCIQAGHFIDGRGNAVLFDEEQVNAQCYMCNIRHKGRWIEYERVMIQRHGKEKVEKMKSDSKDTRQYKTFELIELIDLYKKKLLELATN